MAHPMEGKCPSSLPPWVGHWQSCFTGLLESPAGWSLSCPQESLAGWSFTPLHSSSCLGGRLGHPQPRVKKQMFLYNLSIPGTPSPAPTRSRDAFCIYRLEQERVLQGKATLKARTWDTNNRFERTGNQCPCSSTPNQTEAPQWEEPSEEKQSGCELSGGRGQNLTAQLGSSKFSYRKLTFASRILEFGPRDS